PGHLYGGLGGDAAELRVLDLLLDEITDLDTLDLVERVHQAQLAVRGLHLGVVGDHLHPAEGLVAAVLAVDGDPHQHVLVGVALLGGGGQRGLDGLEDHRFGHALFVGNRVNDQQQFLAHLVTPPSRARRPPACWWICCCWPGRDACRACSVRDPAPPSRGPAAPCRCCRRTP